MASPGQRRTEPLVLYLPSLPWRYDLTRHKPRLLKVELGKRPWRRAVAAGLLRLEWSVSSPAGLLGTVSHDEDEHDEHGRRKPACVYMRGGGC